MRKAMFFDLQGTLGGEFLGDIREFKFYPYSIEALKTAKDNGFLVFIITNQSRIAKGFFSLEEYKEHEDRLINEMSSEGLKIDGFYCCPHNKDQCECKKPKPGMIEAALQENSIDIKNSFVIGDLGSSDMLLAKNIGSKSILVLTGGGHGSLGDYRSTWENVEPTYIANNVEDGVKVVIKDES